MLCKGCKKRHVVDGNYCEACADEINDNIDYNPEDDEGLEDDN